MSPLSRWRAPDVSAAEWRLLWLLGLAGFFGQYDEQLFPLLLLQIQRDLGIPEASLGYLGSLVKLGAIPAFAVLLLADRIGRRRVLLVTIAGYTICNGATALAPDARAFVLFQFLARAFMAAEYLLGLLVIVEEFRPGNRGFGIGVASLLAATGRGLAFGLFALIDDLPFGWRTLYAVGVLPLLLLTVLRRRLPETRRFARLSETMEDEPIWRGGLRPIAGLFSAYPGRLAAVAALSFLWSFSNSPVDFFLPKYAQEVHGWSPPDFAALSIVGGLLGLSGLLVAGWISDRVGRRPTFVGALLCEPGFGVLLYTAAGSLLPLFFVPWVFASVSNDVVGRTYVNEVFPTSHRGTAAGARAIVGTLGGVSGLALEGVLFGLLGSHWLPVCLLAASGLAMPVIVALALPETSGRSLEAIAPERGPPAIP